MIVTVTPQPENSPPRVLIEVDSESVDPLEDLLILRDGAPIRQMPASGFATVAGYDYELPRGVDVTYSVTATVDGVSEFAEATTQLDVVEGWLIHPRYPEFSVALRAAEPPVFIESLGSRVRAAQGTQHQILGSSLPVTTTGGPRKADARTIRLVSTTENAKQRLGTLFLDETPILFRFPPEWGLDFTEGFYAVGDVEDEQITGSDPTTRWTLPLQQVRPPASQVVAQWTWDDLIGEYATWQDVINAFPTWYAVLTNQPE